MSFLIDENKKLRRQTSEAIAEPETLSVPLETGGYSAAPLVKQGERVLKWQKIADGELCVHAPVTGVAEDVGEGYIVIKNEFSQDCAELFPATKTIRELSGEDIAQIAKNAGIWCRQNGMPLYRVIEKCIGNASKMIINLCEDQPFVSSLYRLALEHPDEITGGAKILMKACGVRHAVIAVDSHKRNLIRILREKCASTPLLKVKPISKRYPCENPRLLAYILGSVEPDASKSLPESGYAVFDGRACFDIYNALIKGIPSVSCTVSAAGDCITTPKNLTVPIGTSASHIAQYCGGFSKEPHKIINGGPFDGIAMWDADQPIGKDTCAVLTISKEYYRKKETPCIRCGRCASACPMYLMPMKITAAYDKGDMEKCRSYGAVSCIECGLCSYVCPANLQVSRKMHETLVKLRGENDG